MGRCGHGWRISGWPWSRSGWGCGARAQAVVGLAQVLIVTQASFSPRPPAGFYDLAIVIAIYSAVAYGARLTRLLAVAGGIGGTVAGTLAWLSTLAIKNQLIGASMLFAGNPPCWA